MAKEVSKTQIDRLGERLKKGNISDDDLRLLDQYRRSFNDAYEIVVSSIRRELGLEPTGRPAKSIPSISDKLRRESIRLTQIQDIAGCRLIVSDIAEQDRVVAALSSLFEHVTVVDRRRQPSHGYRAVHVIVGRLNKLVEVQVRTSLQHLWAELSEKFSDVIEPAIKYGGGNERAREALGKASKLVAIVEEMQTDIFDPFQEIDLPPDRTELKAKMADAYASIRGSLSNLLKNLIDGVSREEGETDALPD